MRLQNTSKKAGSKMTDININEVYEEIKYLGELPETSRLIKDYLELREENEKLRAIINELVSRFDEWNTVHPQSDSVISGNLWRSLEETIIKARKECV